MVMANALDFAELVRALAEIASQTTDANTAQRLMTLVHQLMTDAGVPPDPSPGSGQAAGPHCLKRDTDASG